MALMNIWLTFIDQQKSSGNHPWFFLANHLMGPSAEEQLTSGHISPFNDGQGFFAQFDPSKALWDGRSSFKYRNRTRCRKVAIVI